MKKFTGIVLGVLSISILATGCGQKSEELKKDIEEQVLVDEQKEETGKGSLYENKDYSFIFNAPKEWKDNFEVVESKSDILPTAKTQVDFIFAPVAKKIETSDSLLTIYVLDRAEWEKLGENKDEPAFGEFLDEKDDLVYIYQTPESNPYGEETEEGKIFDEMFKAINIKENFELIK